MLKVKLTQEQINELPIRSFEGRVEYIRKTEWVREAAEHLSRERVLGFDIEIRPSFRRGEKHPPALLQLGGSDRVYIFRLLDIGLPDELCGLLANGDIIKSGVALRDDLKELRSLRDFTPRGFVDMGDAARKAGMMHHGLKGLAAILFGYRISKSVRRSNWASDQLTDKQIQYAATDAWLSRELYFEMLRRGIEMTVVNYDAPAVPGEASDAAPA